MRGLDLVGNDLLIPRTALMVDGEAATLVRDYPGMFRYEPDREVYVVKPWASSAALQMLRKGNAR